MSTQPDLPSKISIIVLGVSDLDRSVLFYREMLGLELMGQSGGLAFLSVSGLTLMLNTELAKEAGTIPGATELVFPVESVNRTHDLLGTRGCEFVRTPREVTPGSWAATFLDPDGHRLTLFGAP